MYYESEVRGVSSSGKVPCCVCVSLYIIYTCFMYYVYYRWVYHTYNSACILSLLYRLGMFSMLCTSCKYNNNIHMCIIYRVCIVYVVYIK